MVQGGDFAVFRLVAFGNILHAQYFQMYHLVFSGAHAPGKGRRREARRSREGKGRRRHFILCGAGEWVRAAFGGNGFFS